MACSVAPFLIWAGHRMGKDGFAFFVVVFSKENLFFFSKGRSSNRATHYGVVMIL